MKSTPSYLLIAAILLTAAACHNGGADPQPPVHSQANASAICLQGEPFVAAGTIPVDEADPGDAAAVSGLRWEAHDGCERFVIDLVAEDGSLANAAGRVRAEVLRDLGVVRITLRDVERVDPEATDTDFEGTLARAAYSVWAEEGRWVYVDLHLAEAAEAHVSLLDDPARVVVDLRPGGLAIPPSPIIGERVVVLEPRPGEAAYPLNVTGYARTFEANVVLRIEQNGEEVLESFTTATAWVDAWGHYSFTIEDGPTGPIQLHIGEYSAQDGTWEGAMVELNMR